MLVAATAHAGGFGIPEIGVRRTAMAAVVGRPDDGSAIYQNPAGLVLDDRWQLYVSAGFAFVRTSFTLHAWDGSDRFLGVSPGADGYYPATTPKHAFAAIPMLAVFGPVTPRLSAGAAVYVGNATGAIFDDKAVTRYHLIEGYVVAPQAVLAAAYKLLPSLALGATAGVVNIRIHGERYVFPIIAGADVSNLTGTSPKLVLDGSGWAPSWSLGAYGKPHPRVSWGAVVIGRVDADLQGPLSVTYSADASVPNDRLAGSQTTHQFLPWTFQAGANVDVTPNVEIGSEVRYWLYRQYKRQHTDVVGIFFTRALDTEKDYSDSWQVSGGVRVHDLPGAPGLDLMAGTHYDKSPAPPRSITFDQPSFSHVGLHTGARYAWDRYRLGASYIHYWYEVPTITDSITSPPTNIKGHGSNHIITLSLEVAL